MAQAIPKETTRVVQCKCKHAFQDATYGVGLRLHNLKAKKGKQGEKFAYGCTVCSTLKV